MTTRRNCSASEKLQSVLEPLNPMANISEICRSFHGGLTWRPWATGI